MTDVRTRPLLLRTVEGDDLTRPEGLYAQVAQRLRRDITEGRYKPGDTLPSEMAIAKQFKVSRQTVRQAIALLRAEALVEVEQGRGTFVRRTAVRLPISRYTRDARQPGAGPFESTCRLLGIPGYGELVTVDQLQADERTAKGLHVPTGTEIVYRRRHMHAGDPDAIIQIQEGHFPLSLVQNTPLARAEKVTDGTYAALDAIGHAPVEVTEELTARMPTPTESAIFRSRSGVPVIQVERSTFDATGQVIEWLVVTATADQNIFVYEKLPLT
jgi:GntR family transcriptional regulator